MNQLDTQYLYEMADSDWLVVGLQEDNLLVSYRTQVVLSLEH